MILRVLTIIYLLVNISQPLCVLMYANDNDVSGMGWITKWRKDLELSSICVCE